MKAGMPALTHKGQRGSRVKLGGSILVVVLLENGRQLRSRMSQLSINGGLLSLENPLDESIRVTVVFHLGTTSIRCRAQMLFPRLESDLANYSAVPQFFRW